MGGRIDGPGTGCHAGICSIEREVAMRLQVRQGSPALAIVASCLMLAPAAARAADPAPAPSPAPSTSPAPSEAAPSGSAAPAGTSEGTAAKDWARQDGPRLDVGIDLDMTGSVHGIAETVAAGAHEVNVGVMARVAYEFSRLLALTFRGGYLGSVTYGGAAGATTTSDGFLAPVLVGFRLQLPLSTFRFHVDAAVGYAYGNRFSRWVRSGSGASRHQMVVDLRFGAAVFFSSWLSLDVAFLYRLPNVLVRLVDSKQSEYAHTLGATVGVGFHF